MPLFLIYFYHTVFSHILQLSKPSNLLLSRGMSLFHDISFHRLNMKSDLQILFGLHVYSCTHWLSPRNSPFPPYLGSYTSALLVSQGRRHLFGTPCWSSYLLVFISAFSDRPCIIIAGHRILS